MSEKYYKVKESTLAGITNQVRNLTGTTEEIQFDKIETKLEIDVAEARPDTSDATASASEIFKDETAYVNGNKITGTFTIDDELSEQDDLLAQIESAIENKAASSGGIDTSDATATATDILSGKTAYVNGNKVTGSIATVEQATPSITVNSSGLITASATQDAGYVTSGTKTATSQLSTQAAKTITPSTSSQTAVAAGKYTTGTITVSAIPSTYVKPTSTKTATTYTPTTSDQSIAAGTYCSGKQTIKGDSNLVAGNIKSGVSIFGVAGSYEGSGSSGDSSSVSVETCTVTIKTTAYSTLSKGFGVSCMTVTNGTASMGYHCTTPSKYYDAENTTICEFQVIKNTVLTVWNGENQKFKDITHDSSLVLPLNSSSISQLLLAYPAYWGIPFLVTGDGTITISVQSGS